ncbi:MAG TPA: heme exporter protein CcmB [Anaerolineales bacterium]|nr:heme exporter protein CcmB [Anaerolineales bacterium]
MAEVVHREGAESAKELNKNFAPFAPPALFRGSRLMSFLKGTFAIVRKDLTAEMRSRELVSAMLVFSLLVVLIFNFALELDKQARENVAAGVLWVTFTFAGTLGLNRSFAAEKDRGSFDGLLLAPVDRNAIYFGKLIGTILFMLIVEAIIIPIFTILYGISLFQLMLFGVVLLGTLGYAAVGTLLACMAAHTRTRDVLLPILLFPVTIPVVIAAVKATSGILLQSEWNEIGIWINLLLVYDVIFIAVAVMVFEYLVEE